MADSTTPRKHKATFDPDSVPTAQKLTQADINPAEAALARDSEDSLSSSDSSIKEARVIPESIAAIRRSRSGQPLP